jgi:hypothetical protein
MLVHSTGVTFQDETRATPGCVLIAPSGGTGVYLIDQQGTPVQTWTVAGGLTFWCYLLPNGNLFANERADVRRGVALTGSGWMREYDQNSNVVWEHYDPYQHHDARRLAHGGAVYLAYTDIDEAAQAAIKGGVSGSETDVGICGEAIREVDESGQVMWERHLTEFGTRFPLHPNANRWSSGHTNTLEPLDDGRYLISCKVLNLVFILDRASDEIVWHYQNDEMGGQHDAQMLENGNILIFANGAYASDLHHSQVWEIDPGTNEIVWRYRSKDNPQRFFSPHVGGCQRLASGNTLICEGAKGCVFEVTPDGDVVWEYVCPYFNEVPGFGKLNWLFRARHYPPGSPELKGLL